MTIGVRGISLLDVVGKVFAQIIQERLQHIAENILPESQCGFQKGRLIGVAVI